MSGHKAPSYVCVTEWLDSDPDLEVLDLVGVGTKVVEDVGDTAFIVEVDSLPTDGTGRSPLHYDIFPSARGPVSNSIAKFRTRCS